MIVLIVMATLGLRSGGGISAHDSFSDRVYRLKNRVGLPPNRVHCSLSIKPTAGGRIEGGPEKLERWMKQSVVEIVKNLNGSPLFVHVYGSGLGTTLKAERAAAEDWAQLKGKWVKGEEPCPEGIILVEELKEDEMGIWEEEEGQNGKSTKAWGVLIQGKGDDGGVACYLLKTSKVGCGNLGLFSTHYCLVRVKNFRESAKSQLTSCWLV